MWRFQWAEVIFSSHTSLTDRVWAPPYLTGLFLRLSLCHPDWLTDSSAPGFCCRQDWALSPCRGCCWHWSGSVCDLWSCCWDAVVQLGPPAAATRWHSGSSQAHTTARLPLSVCVSVSFGYLVFYLICSRDSVLPPPDLWPFSDIKLWLV